MPPFGAAFFVCLAAGASVFFLAWEIRVSVAVLSPVPDACLDLQPSLIAPVPPRLCTDDESHALRSLHTEVGHHNSSLPRLKVAALVTATGPYLQFLKSFLATARRFFMTRHDVTYVVFTDRPADQLYYGNDVRYVHTPALGFPETSMMRFHFIQQAESILREYEFVMALDVDFYFVNCVGDEIVDDLVGALHPDNAYYTGEEVGVPKEIVGLADRPGQCFAYNKPYYNQKIAYSNAPFETNPQSTANCQGCPRYFAGGCWGGRVEHVLRLARELDQNIDRDMKRGIVAFVHDESHINHYFNNVQKPRILSVSYVYPDPMGDLSVMDTEHPHLWVDNSYLSGVRRFVPRIINLRKDKGALFSKC